MADSLTTTFSIFFPHYSKPPKPFFRFIPTNIFSRRNKNEVTLCAPISLGPRSHDFGLVSTSELPDGSFVFRFGDVSEIEKIVEMEEPCESESVGEIKSEVKVESNEKLLEVSEEGQVQALVSDINNNGSSNSLLGYEGVRIQENLAKDDNDENPGSTSIPLSDSSLRIESHEDLEKLDNVESSLMAAQEGSLVGPGMVSVIEIPQYDVSEEISQESVDTEATRTEETARADSVESSITAAQADSVESSIMAAQSDNVESSIMAGQADSIESWIMAAQSDSVESSITAVQADSVVIPIIAPMVDFPQKDVCEESTQENVSTEATGTEEYAPSDNVDSPIPAAQADSVQNPVNVPFAEVPDKNVCEESSLKNSNTVGIGTEESDLSDCADNSIVTSQAYSVESSTLIESSPVSTLEVEKSEGKTTSSDLTEASIAAAVEVKIPQTSVNGMGTVEKSEGQTTSSDLTEASSAAAVEVKIPQTSVNGGESSTAGLFLSSGAALLLHPSKALTGGEESYLVTNLNWLGVADGVGHWSLEGSNPGVYARELMENCGKIVSNSSIYSVINPLEVLNKSVEAVQSPGSSTILVAYFDGQTLHVANVGDSGFIIIRNGAVHERSSPMHHEFNFPLHVEKGHDPSELVEGYKIDLEEGDIIVTATDGLFDNLYEEEITYTVLISLQANINPQEIAKLLARRAQDVGMSSSRRSPFADAAKAAGYPGYTGGKLDDVAVIVSLVQSRSG